MVDINYIFIRTGSVLYCILVLKLYSQSLGFMFAACSPCSCPTYFFVCNLGGVCSRCGRLQFKETVSQLPLDMLGKAGSLFSHC